MKYVDADVSSNMPTVCIVQNKISRRVFLQAWINEFHYDNSGGDQGEVCLDFVLENLCNFPCSNFESLWLEHSSSKWP